MKASSKEKKNNEKTKNNCHAAHRQRMRAKIAANGFSSLEDHEKLEVLLYYTIPRANTNEQGHRLIERFGSFSAVLDAPINEIEKVEGVGASSAYFLSLLPQIMNCYMSDKSTYQSEFKCIDDFGRYFTKKFYGCNVEKTYMICLDSMNRIISEAEVSNGTPNSVELNTPLITSIAMGVGSNTILLAHNHPNGICIPSGDDIDKTRTLRDVLRHMNINLLQHFVVVNDSYCGILD